MRKSLHRLNLKVVKNHLRNLLLRILKNQKKHKLLPQQEVKLHLQHLVTEKEKMI
jgi:hypothetical protein